MSVEYRGITFPGYNKPIKSNRAGKKKMVLAKEGDNYIDLRGYVPFLVNLTLLVLGQECRGLAHLVYSQKVQSLQCEVSAPIHSVL